MDFQILKEVFAQGGISLVVAVIAYKAITKLYADMRDDSKQREDALIKHLDRVADTLEKIDGRIEHMDSRIAMLENAVGRNNP